VIPVDAEAVRIFQEICEMRGSPPPQIDPETGKLAQFLLVRPNGRRYSFCAFRYHLEKIEKEAPLKEHPSPHRLRHTYATEMLRAGMRLPVLMNLLGHRTIGMTLRYAQVTGNDVQLAYNEAMAVLNDRYQSPSFPALSERSTRKSTQQVILSQLATLTTKLEAFRRDIAKGPEKKRIQRIVERLRRLAVDFKGLQL
jgi:hypothetical protein